MPIKFLYSLFCLLTGVLSAMSSRAAGPGVINLLPSDYRAANKNWAVAEDDAGTLYAGNDKGLLEFDGLQWRLYELPRASIVRSVAPLSHDVIFTQSKKRNSRGVRALGSRRFGCAALYVARSGSAQSPLFGQRFLENLHHAAGGVVSIVPRHLPL